MPQTGQGQEIGNGDFPPESGEWKVPYGILLLKSTYRPGFGLKTVELGVITEEEVVEGKKVYKFCRLADLFYTSTRRIPDSRAVVNDRLYDNTLDESGNYLNTDGTRVEYKYLYQQDDMIAFVRKLSRHNSDRLLEILRDTSRILKIKDNNKQLLIRSLEIVINESFAHNHR